MSPARAAPAVRCKATLYTIGGAAILRLPEQASSQLPSRGQVAVRAAVNGHACQTVAGPDGESGHWVRTGARQQQAAALQSGQRRPCCFSLAACTGPDLSGERQADQSAMIGLAYAMSDPFGPRGVSQR